MSEIGRNFLRQPVQLMFAVILLVAPRSLMLADLALEESMLLQEHGLGLERKLGCGLFLPHKDVEDLRRRQE